MTKEDTCGWAECSTAAEAWHSDSSTPDTRRSGTPRLMTPARASSPSAGPESPTTATSPRSTGRKSKTSSASALGSPVNPSRSQDAAAPSPIRDGFGRKSSAPFARFVRDTSSLRTSPASSGEFLPMQEELFSLSMSSSLIWPRQATWDLSYAYELLTSEPRTVETDGLRLLPTPAAKDDGRSPEAHMLMKANMPGGARYTITSLAVLARAGFEQPLLPTPAAADSHRGADYAKEGREGSGGDDLPTTLKKLQSGRLLPTPQAADAMGGRREPIETVLSQKRPSGAKATLSLGDAVRHSDKIGKLLPTPTHGDGKASGSRNLPGSKAHKGVSLTDAVQTGNSSTPRGESTSQPSEDGKRSSDLPPGQLTIEDV